MAVDDGLGPQPAPGLQRLLSFQVGPRDATQPRVVATDSRPHPGFDRARPADRLPVQLQREFARGLGRIR